MRFLLMLTLIFYNQSSSHIGFFPLQMYLNYLANYVPNAWNYEHGCSHCDDDLVDLSQLQVSVTNKILSFNLLSPLGYFK